MSQHPDVLDRLRDSAPPSSAPPENGDLWATITASPPDPRLTTRRRGGAGAGSHSRHVLGAVPVTVAVALAVGIAVAALVLLRHGASRPSHPASSAGARGEIIGRRGVVLADTVRVATISIRPAALPASSAARVRVYDGLARALAVRGASRHCVLNGQSWLGPAPCHAGTLAGASRRARLIVADGVSGAQARRVVAAHLHGVVVTWRWSRTHPGDLAAQALGVVTPDAPGGSAVGQSGLEATYDRYLRAGDNLNLSLDANLQRVGESALKTSARAQQASGGSFVAMNPETGAVYAMGSLPTFDPSIFDRGAALARYRRLTSPANGDSLLDRATQSAGPTGSLLTPITAVAALSSGQWSADGVFDDTGQFCVGTGAAEQCRHNSGRAVDGELDLVNALRVSSDDFFYNLGARLNEDPLKAPNGGPLDQWASAFGIGRPTGVDLPNEVSGTLPTPAWREQRNTLESECDRAAGPFAFTNGTRFSAHDHPGWHRSQRRAPGGCGIADGTNRPWSIGDNESLAVGQGDVQVTPLQLAVAYAALANGGTVVRPHLGAAIVTPGGSVVQTIDPAPVRHLAVNQGDLATVRHGLHEAAQSPGGTSDDVMGNFPMKVYGKAGAAQYTNQPDYAWYACFVIDHTKKPIVVVVHVDRGGFGDVAAAPVARQILSQWFYGAPGRYIAGTNASL
ncbi:MAG TPA: penicillin-binding transpeptidase domain-containing protein [Solirubrobacteraceae bacterium]|nr:penicillin-binding transpeptidase domain-containing protein [Solirubrobacteraceae bacterium]